MRNLLSNHPHHLLSILFLSVITFATEQSYPNDDYYHTTIGSTSELPYDENGKLTHHILVYPESSGKCGDLITKDVELYAYQLIGVEGDAQRDFFLNQHDGSSIEINNLQDCPSICLERGMDRSLVTFPTDDRVYFDNKAEHDNYVDWFVSECFYVQVGFINYFSEDWSLDYYWITEDDDGYEVEEYHGEILYGKDNMECFGSAIGTEFRFYDSETKELVYEHEVEFHSMVAIGDDPPHGDYEGDDMTAEIREILNEEWKRHGHVKRTFSPLGFKKSQLPKDLFGSMASFYYNNRNNRVREEWFEKGLYVNWWDIDVKMIEVPEALSDSWHDRLKSLVEEWANVPLEQTSLYGMRRYEEGARLLTHVDLQDTHAASIIVNVAQGNTTEDWPVEIYDHAGRLHQVTMEPGDIVYYESAACLHGRNVPLRGEGSYYVNLFAHYRPTGDPRWLERDNPPGTPKPLVDVGECQLLEGGDDSLVHEGSVGRVTCDNPAIGPYLSPSLVTARSGEDLFNWWRDVGPKEESEQKLITNDVSDEL